MIIIGTTENIINVVFGPQQHNSHVKRWNWWKHFRLPNEPLRPWELVK